MLAYKTGALYMCMCYVGCQMQFWKYVMFG